LAQHRADGGTKKSGYEEATRLGIQAAESGDAKNAESYFTMAFTMQPNTNSAMNLGVSLMRLNRLDESLEIFNKAKDMDSSNNPELRENFVALQQHLDYREEQRSKMKKEQVVAGKRNGAGKMMDYEDEDEDEDRSGGKRKLKRKKEF